MNATDYFKALSDETRLRLLNVAIHYELNVNEIVRVFNMGQSRISRHLKILAECGLLISRREGLWIFYSAASEGKSRSFIQSVQFLFEADPLYRHDLESAEKCIRERSIKTTFFFDSVSKKWERLRKDILGEFELNEQLLKVLPETDTIVDLGCGTGDLLPFLKSKATRVVGVEKSSRMLEEARKFFNIERNGIDIRFGELEHLPLRDREADIALTNLVLHHLSEPKKVIKEVFRIIKPGGLFVIFDFLPHQVEDMRLTFGDLWLGFSLDVLKNWLSETGFATQKIERFKLNNDLNAFLLVSKKDNKDIQGE